ncbi:MAG: EAL domain-containing protein [Alphaproteobacteria bacterium]|nr:EAL domain-containing protein [Alphaproteobacteria bacterium]
MSLRLRLALWIAVAETIFLALFLLADLRTAQPIDLGRTSLAFVAGMAVNGLIAMTIAHVFTRRLSDLADAADAIAAGNPHYCIVAAGEDDIARLGRAFNNIVARMENHLQHVKESRDRLIKPTEAMSEGFALWDRNDRLLLYNKQFRKIFKSIECSIRPGISFSLFARLVSDCLIEHDNDEARERWLDETNAQHREPRGMHDLPFHDGRWTSVYEFKTPDGEVISIYSDVTERMEREMDLEIGRTKLRAIMNSVVDGILTINADGRIESCNLAAAEMFGYRDDDMHGSLLDELVPEVAAIDPTGILSVRGLATMPNDHAVEVTGKRQDGSAFPIELSVTESDLQDNHAFIATIRDVTTRKANEEMIRYQATHDALTDLPNRSVFDTNLEDCLEMAARTGERLAVLFLDLDRFKMVNDTLGHSVGDALLVELGKRLRGSLRESDIVARMGGDEFILVLRNLSCRDDATLKANRILDAIQPPFVLEGHELHVTASIGISMFPDDGKTSEHLLKMADLALYRAKDEGRNRAQLCTPTMDASVQQQMRLETELRAAIEHEELTLVYQPQIHLHTGRLVGVETLARWQHPELGLISPSQFIPLAEETGLIYDLGLWVLRSACRQHKRWREAGLDQLRLAVNMSGRQLQRAGIERDLMAVFEDTDMDLKCLELELTESILMQPGESGDILTWLTGLGINLALDDFGTGYSALSYLRRFPIDRIKIDRSFVNEIDTNQSDAALARAIVGMAHGLNMQVIAEGVETEAQLELLKHYGCDEAQGYLLAKPTAPGNIPGLASSAHGKRGSDHQILSPALSETV